MSGVTTRSQNAKAHQDKGDSSEDDLSYTADDIDMTHLQHPHPPERIVTKGKREREEEHDPDSRDTKRVAPDVTQFNATAAGDYPTMAERMHLHVNDKLESGLSRVEHKIDMVLTLLRKEPNKLLRFVPSKSKERDEASEGHDCELDETYDDGGFPSNAL